MLSGLWPGLAQRALGQAYGGDLTGGQAALEPGAPAVKVGGGPVRVVSATSDQMFREITPEAKAKLPRYKGDLELTNHSAGSITSQAYMKRRAGRKPRDLRNRSICA